MLLSGGDASRLQFPFPKGLFEIQINQKIQTLFSIFCQRLTSLEDQAEALFGDKLSKEQLQKKFNERGYSKIHVFLIVSREFLEMTEKYLEENNYFGLTTVDILLTDRSICSFGQDNQMLLKSKSQILKTSFGNGDLMDFLLNDIRSKMIIQKLNYIHISGIDNVLNRPLDPIFMGFMDDHKLDLVHKIVEKQHPQENVGLFVREESSQKTKVIEYTIFPPKLKSLTKNNEPDGKLQFRHGNMLNFIIKKNLVDRFYELAKGKEGQTVDSKVVLSKANFNYRQFQTFDIFKNEVISKEKSNCIKFERYFLDCFPMVASEKQGFILTKRIREFAPIKYINNSLDTPENALNLLNNFWISEVGKKSECNGEFTDMVLDTVNKIYHCLLCKNVHKMNGKGISGNFVNDETFYQNLKYNQDLN